jgi:hypothetical protein
MWFFYLTILIIFISLVCNSFFLSDALIIFDIEVNDIRNSLATSFITLPAVNLMLLLFSFLYLFKKRLRHFYNIYQKSNF